MGRTVRSWFSPAGYNKTRRHLLHHRAHEHGPGFFRRCRYNLFFFSFFSFSFFFFFVFFFFFFPLLVLVLFLLLGPALRLSRQ